MDIKSAACNDKAGAKMNWEIRKHSFLAFCLLCLLHWEMSKMCEEQGNYFDIAHYTAAGKHLNIKEEPCRKEATQYGYILSG